MGTVHELRKLYNAILDTCPKYRNSFHIEATRVLDFDNELDRLKEALDHPGGFLGIACLVAWLQ